MHIYFAICWFLLDTTVMTQVHSFEEPGEDLHAREGGCLGDDLPLGTQACQLRSVFESTLEMGPLHRRVNSCALKCHLGTPENEGQCAVSGFCHLMD